jgi:hypothetical protein
MYSTFNTAREVKPPVSSDLVTEETLCARCFYSPSQMKLAFENSGKSDKEARRSERGEQFGFHADNSIADWLNSYSRKVDCPTAAVIRASLIYFATATDPVKGRVLLDSQKYQGSLREVMLLAMVRMIARGK